MILKQELAELITRYSTYGITSHPTVGSPKLLSMQESHDLPITNGGQLEHCPVMTSHMSSRSGHSHSACLYNGLYLSLVHTSVSISPQYNYVHMYTHLYIRLVFGMNRKGKGHIDGQYSCPTPQLVQSMSTVHHTSHMTCSY